MAFMQTYPNALVAHTVRPIAAVQECQVEWSCQSGEILPKMNPSQDLKHLSFGENLLLPCPVYWNCIKCIYTLYVYALVAVASFNTGDIFLVSYSCKLITHN